MRLAKVGLAVAVAVGALAPVVGVRAVVSEYTAFLPVVRTSIRGPRDGDALHCVSLLASVLDHALLYGEVMDAREWASGVSLPYPIGDAVTDLALGILDEYTSPGTFDDPAAWTHDIGALALYWAFAQTEGDWRNDWVTWLPDGIQDDAELIGAWLATGDW